MFYKKFSPSQLLQPFVECYFVWESEQDLSEERIFESPPSGFCSIVHNYGDEYFVSNKKYERLAVPKKFVAGQSIYRYQLFAKGRIGITGIVLKPAALSTLFNLNAYDFVEERINLSLVQNLSFINSASDQILSTNTPEAKAKIADELLLKYVQQKNIQPDAIDLAANTIIEKRGLLNVGDIIRDSFMSRRTFERKFFQKVGLSPKYYARIRRISYLMNLIAGKQKVNWSDVFMECEYYDQAHFIKDFEEFLGTTPSQYLAENQELAQYVEKPKPKQLDKG